MANAAEVSFSELEGAFTRILASVPAEAEATTTGGHAFGIAFEFDGGGIETGNVVSLSAVCVPGGIS